MNNGNKIIMIDSSSYSYYRVTATIKYWELSKKESEPSPDNQEFMEMLGKHYLDGLEKFGKKLNISLNQMYNIRDCPIEQIWRRKIFPQYKEHRRENKESKYQVGPFIKILNEKYHGNFKHTLRINGCEADDIIFTLVQLFSKMMQPQLLLPLPPSVSGSDNENSSSDINGPEIYIVSSDSDYYQIAIDHNIHLIDPNKFIEHKIINPFESLETKIKKGDPCDNIPAAKNVKSKLRLNRQLIDLTYMPREYQDQIIINLIDNKILDNQSIPSNFRPESVQLGLCCINTLLASQDPKIFCSRKPTLQTVQKEGIKYLKTKALENCADLEKMIHWNAENGIRTMRISSDLFPHISNGRIKSKKRQMKNPRTLSYSLNFAKDTLARIGRIARLYKMRLTFHPSQFNVLGTSNPSVLMNTLIDLRYHARILDLMHCDQSSIMIIHGGGLYGDKAGSIERWMENYKKMPANVKRRLVLENDERYFSIDDCLQISKKINIPIVFDTHHFECYKTLHPEEQFKDPYEYIEEIIETWKVKNMKPKFHVSEQGEGKIGHHSEYIQKIPQYLLEIPEKYNINVDIMIEAKMKEQAIYHLYELYPMIDPRNQMVDLPS